MEYMCTVLGWDRTGTRFQVLLQFLTIKVPQRSFNQHHRWPNMLLPLAVVTLPFIFLNMKNKLRYKYKISKYWQKPHFNKVVYVEGHIFKHLRNIM